MTIRAFLRAAFGKRERDELDAKLAELERGLAQLDAPVFARRLRQLRDRVSCGEDVTDDLSAFLREHEMFLGIVDNARALRTACLSRGWIDLADEYAALMTSWDGASEQTRLASLERINVRMQQRLQGQVAAAHVERERVVERQILVRRCAYCGELTPVDLTACRGCGAKA